MYIRVFTFFTLENGLVYMFYRVQISIETHCKKM